MYLVGSQTKNGVPKGRWSRWPMSPIFRRPVRTEEFSPNLPATSWLAKIRLCLRHEVNEERKRRTVARPPVKETTLFGQIILVGVFLDHAVRGEARDERGHAAAHPFEPFTRNPLGIAVEEHGDDLFGKGLV